MTKPWKVESLNVKSIDLDHFNPRLSVQNQSQREIIAELIENSELLELSGKLARSALADIPPLERIIVLNEGGNRYIVLEGNRRVAAVKLLLDPSLAPDDALPRFSKISNQLTPQALSLLNPLPAITAPTRDAAAAIISEKHTNSVWIRGWNTLMQARFVEQQVRDQGDAAKVAANFSVPHSQVARFIRQAEIFTIVKSLPFEQKFEDKLKEDIFPITSLERLYNNPHFRKAFGIHFDKDGHVIGAVDKSEFTRGFSRVVSDLLMNRTDSRKLDTSEKIEEYVDSLGKDLPDLSKTDTFTVANFSSAHPIRRARPAKRNDSQRVQRTLSIIPKRFHRARFESPKLQKLFDELKKLNADSVPNSSAIVFRSFLQILFQTFIKSHRGAFGSVRARNPGVPTLGELMEFLGNENQTLLQDKSLRKVLTTAKSQKDQLASLDSLNAYAHNDALLINGAGARENWHHFEAVIEFVLLEIGALQKGGAR